MSKNKTLSDAMKGNQNALGHSHGRPTDYKNEYNEQAYKLTLLGATDKELADFFNVEERTINNWKKEKADFFQSIRAGKEIADSDVAQSFYNNAKGFISVNKKAIKKKVWNKEAKRLVDEVEMVDEVLQHQPNAQAGIFWLKNRQPDKWKDKTEVETSQTQPDLSKLTDDEKATLLKISRKLNG